MSEYNGRYRVVYPQGNRNRLTVVEAQDFDDADYDLASRQVWYGPEGLKAAQQYARELATINSLTYIVNNAESALLD